MHKDTPLTTPPELLTKAEAAAMLNLGQSTLERYWRAGQVPPPMKLGATVRWRRTDLVLWIADGCPANFTAPAESLLNTERTTPAKPSPSQTRELLTVDDLARMFRLSKRSVWRWVAEGRLPAPLAMTSRIRRWDREAVEAAIVAMQTAQLAQEVMA